MMKVDMRAILRQVIHIVEIGCDVDPFPCPLKPNPPCTLGFVLQ